MYSPALADGVNKGMGFTDDTRKDISADEIRRWIAQYDEAIAMIGEVENKTVVLTAREYTRLPAAFVHARRIYRAALAELKAR